jgi:hypothetical protein
MAEIGAKNGLSFPLNVSDFLGMTASGDVKWRAGVGNKN